MNEPKILIYDIENAPNQVTTWGKYDQTALWVEDYSYMLTFAWKWLGDKETQVRSLPDYTGYKPGKPNDKKLVKELWNLLNEADYVIAHNGDSFDQKVAQARFIANGLPPVDMPVQIDTKKMAKQQFRFFSNSLDDLGDFLGLGRKESTGGYSLWRDCMEGKDEAWKKMCDYNIQDVELLEAVYLKLRPWAKTKLNYALTRPGKCPKCGEGSQKDFISRGLRFTIAGTARRSWQCKKNGCHFVANETEKVDKPKFKP